MGIVTGAVSAVTGVIGAFQMRGMNKSLDLIVLHTLQTANDLSNLRADAWLREAHLFAKLDDMWRTSLNIYDAIGRIGSGGGTNTYNITVNAQTSDPRALAQGIIRELKLMSPAFAGG